MTFILTAVAVGGTTEPTGGTGRLLLEEVTPKRGVAGYVPGLARHLGRPIEGRAFYLVTDDDGYRSSNALFPYPEEDDDQPVRLAVPAEFRQSFDAILRDLLLSSPEGSVVLVSEYNGAVTDPDSAEELEVDVLGPWSRSDFWRHHDLGDVVEESVVILEERAT
jgi:hypothetical protein